MKKLIITVVLVLTTSFMGMTAWAAAIGSGTLKKDFSSGSTLSSTEMNTNFTVIENAVNATNSLTTTLPDGVSTYLSFYLAPPNDYTTGNTTVNAYWSGCEGFNVRLGHSKLGYFVGDNGLVIASPTLSTLAVTAASALSYTIFQSLYQVTGGFGSSSFMTFTLGRAGGDGLDTCTGTLTLRGVELIYPTVAGDRKLSIPVNALAR